MFHKNCLAKIQELTERNQELEKQLETLKQQHPRLLEMSDLLKDLDSLGAGLLNVQRIPVTEVYRWRNE